MKVETFFTAAALLGPCGVSARSVFAHFMVGNAENYTLDDWTTDIKLAKEAHIDAFALNIAFENNIGYIMPNAFAVAESLGFKLFLSFDYAGNGSWPKDDVAGILATYTGLAAYFKYNGQNLVSTFEGPDNADDWIKIKQDHNVFFMPDWSSLGAKEAMARAGGVADGLFSWAAWPWGPQDMDTYTDASYLQYLDGKPYMMPVSPWFFTNLPGYDKNWLWRGDSLWYDRWVQASYNKTTPGLVDNTQFIEIISWNDYGESHYIGPLYDKAMEAFTIGKAPSNFAQDMPHDGWRLFLPYVIDLFKTGTATITQEGLTAWYRLSPGAACVSTGTVGNTASQLQIEFAPNDIVQDKIFFSALLTSDATIAVTVGGVTQPGASWIRKPDDHVGIYHGSVPFSGTGAVIVTLSRNGAVIAQINGKAISSGCPSSLYNAWVGSFTIPGIVSAQPLLSLSQQACINGTGVNNFGGLCSFACEYGYCPATACTCRQMGRPIKEPPASGVVGYPIAGEDASYSGLCAYNCNHGYCPSGACGTTSVPLTIPDVSDFAPPACRAGTGTGALTGLCSFSCTYGFCPRLGCTCTAQGALIDAPPKVNVKAKPIAGLLDYDLCNFACSHGYCPDVCISTGNGSSGDVYYPPSIWAGSNPQIPCLPPCKVILPPYPLGSTTTITFKPMVTSVWTSSGGHTGTKTTTLTLAPLVTDGIPFWAITIGASVTTPLTIFPLQSFMPPSVVVTLGPNEATFKPVPSGSATPAPSFPGTSQPVTIQPQATSSVSTAKSVPSVTWSSAASTATCTTGCGTDSCALFGGCSSSDPGSDCGTQGCGGGCSIQGCDQTCGVTCSTDQHHAPPAGSNGDLTALPIDYDGPDGANSDDWNPSPIDKSFASSATSAMAKQLATAHAAVSSMLADWNNDGLKTTVQATVASVIDTLTSIGNDVDTQVQIAGSRSNADVSAVVSFFDSLFTDATESIRHATTLAVSLPGPPGSPNGDGPSLDAGWDMNSADDAISKIEEQTSISADDDICESAYFLPIVPFRLKAKRAAPPDCSPAVKDDPGAASNAEKIPQQADCLSHSGINTWSNAEILDALKQAVKYAKSPSPTPPKDGWPNWQTATKGRYPHAYGNSDGLSFTDECLNAGTDFSDLVEFPIVKGGPISAGKNSKIDVGTDRVVFRFNEKVKIGNDGWSWIYCGIMTHYSTVKVLFDGKYVLPFKLC